MGGGGRFLRSEALVCNSHIFFRTAVLRKLFDIRFCRLRAVSLLCWSVEQNARDTQMTTRVADLPPSFLASSGLAAQGSRARALPLLNVKKKRDCSQFIDSVSNTDLDFSIESHPECGFYRFMIRFSICPTNAKSVVEPQSSQLTTAVVYDV